VFVGLLFKIQNERWSVFFKNEEKVTFSKRQSCLWKTASESSTAKGSQIFCCQVIDAAPTIYYSLNLIINYQTLRFYFEYYDQVSKNQPTQKKLLWLQNWDNKVGANVHRSRATLKALLPYPFIWFKSSHKFTEKNSFGLNVNILKIHIGVAEVRCKNLAISLELKEIEKILWSKSCSQISGLLIYDVTLAKEIDLIVKTESVRSMNEVPSYLSVYKVLNLYYYNLAVRIKQCN